MEWVSRSGQPGKTILDHRVSGTGVAVFGLAETPGVHDLETIEGEVKRDVGVPYEQDVRGHPRDIAVAFDGEAPPSRAAPVRATSRRSRVRRASVALRTWSLASGSKTSSRNCSRPPLSPGRVDTGRISNRSSGPSTGRSSSAI